MKNLLIFLIWILYPVLVWWLFSDNRFKLLKNSLFYVSCIGSAVYLLMAYFELRFKYAVLDGLLMSFGYLFLLMCIGYGWLYFKKIKWTKIVFIILFLIPSGFIITIIGILIASGIHRDNDASWTSKEFTEQDYTVLWNVDSWDNMEYNISIKIYKNVHGRPFMQQEIYKYEDWNIELESVRYIRETNTMQMIMSRGSEKWEHCVDLDSCK